MMLQFLPFKFFQTVFDRSFSVPDFLEFVQIFYNSFTILYMILCGIYIYINTCDISFVLADFLSKVA